MIGLVTISQVEIIFLVIVILTIISHEVGYYIKDKIQKEKTLEELIKLREETAHFNKTLQGLQFEEDIGMKILKNKKTISGLLEKTATKEDYNLYVKEIGKAVKGLYADYKFQLLKPNSGDLMSGYAVAFQIFKEEDPKMFEGLFKLAIDKGFTDKEINKAFREAVAAGDIIDLGEVILMEEETGLSSILRGDDLQIFIGFETPEYKEEREAAQAEIAERSQKDKETQDKYIEQREEAYKLMTEASALLKVMSAEIAEEKPEYLAAYEQVKNLYNN